MPVPLRPLGGEGYIREIARVLLNDLGWWGGLLTTYLRGYTFGTGVSVGISIFYVGITIVL